MSVMFLYFNVTYLQLHTTDWQIKCIDLNCCVISFTALIDLISWNQTIDYLYSDGFEVDPA